MGNISIYRVHEKIHSPRSGVCDFEFRCLTSKKKFRIEGGVKTEHRKERMAKIVRNLKKVISEHKHVKSRQLEKAVLKALHHDRDLKFIKVIKESRR